MSNSIEIRRFEAPDDMLDMKERGGIAIIKMADGTTGMRATFEPGWTWEKDEKPLLGSPDACPMPEGMLARGAGCPLEVVGAIGRVGGAEDRVRRAQRSGFGRRD